jgi:hypothetical protein
MNKAQMKKLFPMLRLLATKLDASDLQIALPWLKHEVCLGLLECIDHGVCNKSIPPEVRKELRERLVAHKKKFRYLVNKKELLAPSLTERDEILDKKTKTMVDVSNCMEYIFKVAIPALGEYVSEPTEK